MSDAFILGDWGTTQLRLFLCNDAGVLDRRFGRGIAQLERSPPDEFAAVAGDWLDDHRVDDAVLAGMVGSRTGWLETAYAPCPATAADLIASIARTECGDVSIAIVPGLSCVGPSGAPDVMRGEETQLFGALALEPRLRTERHVVALPGTHTKWVVVEDGRVIQFQTALTGELFALLRTSSTLLKTGGAASDAFDDDAFATGLDAARSERSLLHALFQVRSQQLVAGATPSYATSLLSGLLIGSDVNGAAELHHATDVTLIGERELASLYARALEARDARTRTLDGNECALAGLNAFARALSA
jgi:2-dehydro-3-deoxygalactonokinase